MTKEEKATVAAEKAAAKAAKEAAKAAEKAAMGTYQSGDSESVVVVDANGEVIREYSLEAHGEGFAELAEQFASKEEGRKVK